MGNHEDNKDFLLEQSGVSGIVSVTVDGEFICLKKFNKHIKLEVVFDKTISKIKDGCSEVVIVKQENCAITDVVDDVGDNSLPADIDNDVDENGEFQTIGINLDDGKEQSSIMKQESGGAIDLADDTYGIDDNDSVLPADIDDNDEDKDRGFQMVDVHLSKDREGNALIANHDTEISNNGIMIRSSRKRKAYILAARNISLSNKLPNNVEDSLSGHWEIAVEDKIKKIRRSKPKAQIGSKDQERNASFSKATRKKSAINKVKEKSQSGIETGRETSPEEKRQPKKQASTEMDLAQLQRKDGQFSCPYCMQTFLTQSKLGDHYRIKSDGYSCDRCGTVSNSWAFNVVHQKVSHNIHLPISPNTQKSSEGAYETCSLVADLKDASLNKYKCEICHNEFVHLDSVKRHMLQHTGEKRYGCCVCEVRTSYLWQLMQHMKKHSTTGSHFSQDDMSVDVNNPEFETQQLMKLVREHSVTLSKNICHTHSEVENEKSSLKSNIPEPREMKREKGESPTSPSKDFKCLNCLKTFQSDKELYDHCRIATEVHSCEKCHKAFKYKTQYLVHLKLTHDIEVPISLGQDAISNSCSVGIGANGLKTYICNICNSSMSLFNSLNNHMRKHTKEKAFECCLCKETFIYRKEFNSHIHVTQHSNSLLYKSKVLSCTHCSQIFESEQEYIAHHEVQSPTFTCQTCNEPQKSKAHLIVHTNIVHEMHIPLSLQTDANGSCSTGFTGQLVSYVKKCDDAVNSYKCNVCNFIIKKDLKVLGTHVMKHTGEFAYKCCACEVKESDLNDFRSHLASHTNTYKMQSAPTASKSKNLKLQSVINCSCCSKEFKSKIDFDKHFLLPDACHVCEICFKSFKYKALLIIHCNIVHHIGLCPKGASSESIENHFGEIICEQVANKAGIIAYKCNLCTSTFLDLKGLQIHIMRHTHENSHKCCVCDFKDCTSYAIKKHQMEHSQSNSKQYECKRCGMSFKDHRQLIGHRLVTHQSKCDLCGEEFENIVSLKFHLNLYHKDDERVFTCNECGKLYTSKYAFKTHKKYHKYLSKQEQCPECGIFVKNLNRHINRHMKLRHFKSSKDFSCDKCSKEFIDDYSLRTHMRSHTKLRPYSCPQCPKKFHASGALSRHLKIHTKLKPYVCEICGKACNRQANLQTHMRVHNKTPKMLLYTQQNPQ